MGSSLVSHSEILKRIRDRFEQVRLFRLLLADNNRQALVIAAALDPLVSRQREQQRLENYPAEKDPFI